MTRVLKTAAATLTHTFAVGETPTDSTTTVTVAITTAAGVAVSSGNAVSAGVDTGGYIYALAGQSALNQLVVAWSGTIAGAAVLETEYVEIVGGFFFTLAQGRGSDTSLTDPAKYPEAALLAAREEVEQECETICDRAFVPRYERVVLDGTGSGELLLGMSEPNRSPAHIRAIRSVKVAPTLDGTFVPLTAGQLAALAVAGDGTLRRTDGLIWTEGRANVIVEYELGLDTPPVDLIRAALIRFRSRLNIHKTGIPDRATSFSSADGGTYRIDLPGAYKTGLPDVDAPYARYSRRSGAGTGTNGRAVPASRALNFDPQRTSLFHGGIR